MRYSLVFYLYLWYWMNCILFIIMEYALMSIKFVKSFLGTVAVALMFCVSSNAEDIVATTSNGSTVILHDNGRWEYYHNNAKIRDIRTSAIPEDAKYEVSVMYESPEKIKKDVRMAMDADFATEEEIRDSLRKVPKGGIVYFQVPTKQIKPGLVRTLTYSLFDTNRNTPFFTTTVSDTEAMPSEDTRVSNLLVVPIYSNPRSKALLARIEARGGMDVLEIDIPIR